MNLRSHFRLAVALFVCAACASLSAQQSSHDLVLQGGRVVDPESGLDAVRNVGIRDGKISEVSERPLRGAEVLDVEGLVVAPGFIDLHAHGQDLESSKLQAADGVTTQLECEIGVWPVADWYGSKEGKAIINYGATAGHLTARIYLMHGLKVGQSATMPPEIRAKIATAEYAHKKATAEEIEKLGGYVEQGIDEGALGVGMGIAYTPKASGQEVLRIFGAAAKKGVPVFVHMRGREETDDNQLAPLQEVIANAAATGASLHICHLNSSTGDDIRDALAMILAARDRGMDITTEAYPYTAGSTLIQSALFDKWETESDDYFPQFEWPATGERLTRETFKKYRDEGGWVIQHMMKEENIAWAMAQPAVIVASDGVPFVNGRAHPRGAGCFARVLGYYSREKQALSLNEAIRKITLAPAQRLEKVAPAMKNKGRIKAGADADITIFNADKIIDRATFKEPAQPSAGIEHVIVGGKFVLRDGNLIDGAAPGQPIRGSSRHGS
jgi:N-acyl-D-aspartate/D-glutamate deacylase